MGGGLSLIFTPPFQLGAPVALGLIAASLVKNGEPSARQQLTLVNQFWALYTDKQSAFLLRMLGGIMGIAYRDYPASPELVPAGRGPAVRAANGSAGVGPAQPDRRPAVLVTGGSAGIGLALARGFAARRHDLFLVARDKDALRATAAAIESEFGVSVGYAAQDLAQPEAASIVLTKLDEAGCYVDILVNCAGVAVSGEFLTNDLAKAHATLNLNVGVATELMYACLPGMVERRRGGVLNIASLAGMTPMPYLALYAATKSYLISLSRAVATEVAGSGVTVSVAAPGPVDTSFFARNFESGASGLGFVPGLSAEAVAHTAIEGFLARQRVITPGLLGSVSRFAIALLPYAVLAPFVARAMRAWSGSGPSRARVPSQEANPQPAKAAAVIDATGAAGVRSPAKENAVAMAAQS